MALYAPHPGSSDCGGSYPSLPNAHLPAILDLTFTGRLKFYYLTGINSFVLSDLYVSPNLQRWLCDSMQRRVYYLQILRDGSYHATQASGAAKRRHGL